MLECVHIYVAMGSSMFSLKYVLHSFNTDFLIFRTSFIPSTYEIRFSSGCCINLYEDTMFIKNNNNNIFVINNNILIIILNYFT